MVLGMPPSAQHEALHRIFQHDTRLFARTLRQVLGIDLPDPERVTMLGTDLTEPRPHVRSADSVLLAELLVENPGGRYIIIIESQTDPDEDKWFTWPYYIAHLRDKYRCEAALVVVSSRAETAQWARQPIRCGPPGLTSMIVTPAGLGPDNVPPVTRKEQACADVCSAVFSALTHSRSPQAGGILEVLASALGTLDTDTATLLAELTEAGLAGTGGLPIWRHLMTIQPYPYVSELRAQGRAQGKAEAIAGILDRRHIALTGSERQDILGCTDPETLDVWFDLSFTVITAAGLFAARQPPT
jgi:hypothetical protein